MSSQVETARQVTRQFCLDFVEHPYQCYTEHGLHALFFTRLYHALPDHQRYTWWNGHQVCVIQKEYPTAHNLGKSKRQHWDISLIRTPLEATDEDEKRPYDFFKLAAAVELGMNVPKKHLVEDIRRLCHKRSNVEQGFVVHLYRLTKPKAKFSRRDWSVKSPRILTPKEANESVAGKRVEVLYGMADSTGTYESGVWLLGEGEPTKLAAGGMVSDQLK